MILLIKGTAVELANWHPIAPHKAALRDSLILLREREGKQVFRDG